MDSETYRGEAPLAEARKRFSRTKHKRKQQCHFLFEAAEVLLDTQKKKQRVLRTKVLRLARRIETLGIRFEGMFDEARELGFVRLHDVQLDIKETCEMLEQYSEWLLRLGRKNGIQSDDYPRYEKSLLILQRNHFGADGREHSS